MTTKDKTIDVRHKKLKEIKKENGENVVIGINLARQKRGFVCAAQKANTFKMNSVASWGISDRDIEVQNVVWAIYKAVVKLTKVAN